MLAEWQLSWSALGPRPLLLRRGNERARAPVRLPRGDRSPRIRTGRGARSSSSTTRPRTDRRGRARMDGRPRRRPPLGLIPPERGGRRRTTAGCSRRPGRPLPAPQRGLRLRPGSVGRRSWRLSTRAQSCSRGRPTVAPAGIPQPCAWRLPGLVTTIAGALFVHRGGGPVAKRRAAARVGWVQSSAMLVRREAAREVGWLDPGSSCIPTRPILQASPRRRRVILYAPAARAVHHEQLATDRSPGSRRVVGFHRGRDRYMRKHHGASRRVARPLSASPTRCAPCRALSSRARIPACTSCTLARRSIRRAVRGCARRPRSST